ncbi:hypothetical protein L7F22_062689 [Adiantum nelumboides]|nr:hypothetical protein [Adiantum nelumboides]
MWKLTTGVCRVSAAPQRRENFIEVACRLLCSATQLDDAGRSIIQEGQAKILLHGNDVFYNKVQSHANRYKRVIVPVLSVWIDFYVRVFVRIYTSAKSVKESSSKLSYVYQCTGCHSFDLQPVGQVCRKGDGISYKAGVGPTVSPECGECGKHWRMGGPLWSKPLHDSEWVSSVLKNITGSRSCYPAFDKVHCLLTAVTEELPDVPLFVSLQALSATLKCLSPSKVMFCSALSNAGYQSSGCHVSPSALKTDAPMHVIWDIMRCWVNLHPIKKQPDSSIGSIMLSKEPTLQADFRRITKGGGEERKKRFMPNPEKN